MHLTRTALASAADSACGAKKVPPAKQRSRAAASNIDPRVRQQLWKLANPPPGHEAAAGRAQDSKQPAAAEKQGSGQPAAQC